MCGRRKIDREYPEIAMKYGDMDFELVKKLSHQLPPNIIVQFHNNGEPLLYPKLREAIRLFKRQIKCMDTNAKLLLEKADEVIGNLDTLTISVIENDSEGKEQYEIVKRFLKLKGSTKPLMVYRLLGDVQRGSWEKLPGIIATRILHKPEGSFGYQKKVTVPEIGICIEALSHLAINRFGKVSICVRFDPKGEGIIGDATKEDLIDIWNGLKRRARIKLHIEGRRKELPLCN